MHVNEQTRRSLRRVVRRSGLRDVQVEVGQWVYTDFVPSGRAKRVYERLSTVPGAKDLVVANLWAEARR